MFRLGSKRAPLPVDVIRKSRGLEISRDSEAVGITSKTTFGPSSASDSASALSLSSNLSLAHQRMNRHQITMSSRNPSPPTADVDAHTKPPFVVVAGIPNFRDIGGYAIASSANHSVRRGAIYRCAEPSRVLPDGISAMQGLGITHIYDLRSNPEIERNQAAGRGGVVEWEGCERVFVPVFADEDYSPEALAGRFMDYASGSAEVGFHAGGGGGKKSRG